MTTAQRYLDAHKAFKDAIAECDAFMRNLKVFAETLDDYHSAYGWHHGAGTLFRTAREHVEDSWRAIQYAKANLQEN